MANIIDALVVTLGLDASGFTKGQQQSDAAQKKIREDAAKTAKELQAQGQKAAEFFTQMKNEALSLFAVILGSKGVIDFTRDATDGFVKMGIAARNIGVSVPNLALVRNLVSRAGGDADAATASFENLAQKVAALKMGVFDKGLATLFSFTGAKPGSSPLEILDALNQYAQKVPRQQLNFVAGQGGITDPGLLDEIAKKRADFLADIETVRKNGLPDENIAPTLSKLYTSFADLRTVITNTSNSILEDWSPAVTKAIDKIKEWIVENPKAAKTIEEIGVASTALFAIWTGAKFVAAIANIGKMATALGELSAAGGAAGAAGAAGGAAGAAGAAGAIGGATGGLLGVGSLAALIWALTASGGLPDEVTSDAPKDTSPDSAAMKWWKEFATKHLGFHFPDAPQTQSAPTAPADKGPVERFMDRLKSSPLGHGLFQQGSTSDVDKLMQMGWTREQAAGIVANINAESYGRADAVGDGGKAYGLAQWHPDRQAAFAAWAGHDIRSSTRDEQLAFINYELRYGAERRAGAALAQALDAASAGSIVSRLYERPADAAGEAQRRAALADAISLSAAPPRPSASPGGSGGSQTTIGSINVYTQASDARGIARDIRRELLLNQANASLT